MFTRTKAKGFALLSPVIIIGLGIVLAAGTGLGVYYYQKKQNDRKVQNLQSTITNIQNEIASLKTPSPALSTSSTATTSGTTSSTATSTPPVIDTFFSGKLTLLNQDLGLIKTADQNFPEQVGTVTYYQAGTYIKGDYAGYKRIIGIRTGVGMGGTEVRVFATKDDKTYILDKAPTYSESNPGYLNDDFNTEYSIVNKSKVPTAHSLDSDQPATIKLNDQLSLIEHDISTYTQNETAFALTDLTGYQALTSPNLGLTLYYKPATMVTDTSSLTAIEKEEINITNDYIQSDTTVLAVDSTGLIATYKLTTNSSFAGKLTYNWLNKTKITQPIGSFYNEYGASFIQACSGIKLVTKVAKNVSDNDLTQIGSMGNTPLYSLINKNHPLYKATYNHKIGKLDAESFAELNQNSAKPTYAQYVAKQPLLFFKDYWNRWVVLSEYDYLMTGGCGKPVVYLYPQQAEQITVKFTGKMRLDTQIPTYQDGWKILAQPNGLLKDLQPQFTSCSKLQASTFGSEYAYAACIKNEYPYIYWAGRGLNAEYPEPTQGWIVKQDDLSSFMNGKLDEIGLNAQEKKDMLDYWLVKMQKENTPYYRISFLQNAEMNQIAPMSIQPQPDSYTRVFLDYKPLVSMPKTVLEPQNLQKFDRKGFVVVEWGGLKR